MKCRRVNNLWWLADGTIRIQVQVCHFKLSFYPILTIPPPHTFKDCIRSAACLSVQHGRNSVGLKRVSFYSNFLDKHQVFLTRKNLWLLKILTVEKVLFYREKKKKVVCDLPVVSNVPPSLLPPSPFLFCVCEWKCSALGHGLQARAITHASLWLPYEHICDDKCWMVQD